MTLVKEESNDGEATPMSPSVSPKNEDSVKSESPDDGLTPLATPTSPSKPRASVGRPKKERSPTTPSTPRAPPQGPQLIGDLPRAEEEALKTFVNIPDNIYQYNTLARPKSMDESYQCDCVYEHGESDRSDACGEGSECINRLTQVECVDGECRCGAYCQNQRFQRKQTASLHIVQTEKKGFGLRAAEDISKDAFLYEYIGEVVSHPSFMKRMRDYGEEGLRHFYFMMLQKDEYIDATKKGGIGRFVNHSCSPNAYVAKWTVGNRLRMGIFAKRDIKKDEELTFNYNVDRYGHDAQPCYCGEPNCVGFLGGKTQTDLLSTMDDLYLDALGISEEVEALSLKGTKKKKGRKLDEDFMPVMKPVALKDVPKVVQAMKQTTSKKVMAKLLTRIKITEDHSVLRAIMRLRAFSVMRALFQEYGKDLDVVILGMECLLPWPLTTRNKVDDSKIEPEIEKFTEHDNERISTLAKKLIDHWATFSSGYRIPKRQETDTGIKTDPGMTPPPDDDLSLLPKKPSMFSEPIFIGPKPLGRSSGQRDWLDEPPRKKWTPPTPMNRDSPAALLAKATPVDTLPSNPNSATAWGTFNSRKELQRIYEEAAKKHQEKLDEEAKARKEEEEKAEKDLAKKRKREEREEKKKDKSTAAALTKEASEDKLANKEKRLQKLISAVVIKQLQPYVSKIGKEAFKEHARTITKKISDREKTLPEYEKDRLESLSDSKLEKIVKFTKAYMEKHVKGKSSKSKSSSSHARSHSNSHSTSNSHAGASGSQPKMTPASDRTPPDEDDTGQTEMDVDGEGEVELDMDVGDEAERVNGDIDDGPHTPPLDDVVMQSEVAL